jgi:hypothetical protein
MPDVELLGQIAMLTNLMSTMPPQVDQHGRTLPARIPFPRGKAAQWATELVSVYGVRVHPELAAEQTLPGGSGRRIDEVPMTAEDLIRMLRNVPNVPSLAALADRLTAALGDPVKVHAEMAAIRREYPDVMKTARMLQARAEAEAGPQAAR